VTRSKLEAFRERASTGRLVRFYKSADELKSQILHSLSHAVTWDPGEGWVRGKNSSRLQDLEDLNALHKQVRALEKELRELRVDPQLALAQGDDSVSWEIEFGLMREDAVIQFSSTQFATTWNELLSHLSPMANTADIGIKSTKLLARC